MLATVSQIPLRDKFVNPTGNLNSCCDLSVDSGMSNDDIVELIDCFNVHKFKTQLITKLETINRIKRLIGPNQATFPMKWSQKDVVLA